MAKDKNEVIELIQKLLALASNNPSKEEAQSAAAKAQELIARHGIQMADIEALGGAEAENIEYTTFYTGSGKAWKFDLAHIIGDNFRCKHFWYGRQVVAFYGYETDAKAATEVYKFVFKVGHKLATHEVNYRHNRGFSADGTYNSFVIGFMKGLREKLDAQCKALMIVMAPEVTEAYAELSKTFSAPLENTSPKLNSRFDRNAFEKGIDAGRNVMGKREIEACSNC